MDVVQQQRNMARRRTGAAVAEDGKDATTPTTKLDSLPEGDNSSSSSSGSNDKPTSNGSSSSSSAYTAVTRPGPFARFRGRLTNSNNGNNSNNNTQQKQRRSSSAPAAPGRRSTRTRRRLLIQDHFNVETTAVVVKKKGSGDDKQVVERPVVLPGLPQHDDDWQRDTHDFFNLIVLIPVVALNIMNWNWDQYLWWVNKEQQHKQQQQNHHHEHYRFGGDDAWADAWTGEWFESFFWFTLAYFLIDLAWILVVPSCVKSPSTIIQHHVATMLYLLIPYFHEEFRWCMGACMIVEINTWFLIARRVFNKQGFPPWKIELGIASIRIKLISVFFYVTWIAIRCIMYPYLMPIFYNKWLRHSEQRGTHWNITGLCVPLHFAFCLLNLKWSYDLFTSKIRFWARAKNNRKLKDTVDKGL